MTETLLGVNRPSSKDPAVRKILCSINAIESLSARYRRAVKARGHFPAKQSAMSSPP